MCLFRKRRQDRIAREIAASHQMLADYRAARRQGLSPLEALAEWDLLDDETIKKLEGETTDIYFFLFGKNYPLFY